MRQDIEGLERASLAYGAGVAEAAVLAGMELALAAPCLLGKRGDAAAPRKQLIQREGLFGHAVKPGLDDDIAHGLESVDSTEGVVRAQPVASRLRVALSDDRHALAVLQVTDHEHVVRDDDRVAGAEAAGDPRGHVEALLDEELRVGAGALGHVVELHHGVEVIVGIPVHLLGNVAESLALRLIAELVYLAKLQAKLQLGKGVSLSAFTGILRRLLAEALVYLGVEPCRRRAGQPLLGLARREQSMRAGHQSSPSSRCMSSQ